MSDFIDALTRSCFHILSTGTNYLPIQDPEVQNLYPPFKQASLVASNHPSPLVAALFALVFILLVIIAVRKNSKKAAKAKKIKYQSGTELELTVNRYGQIVIHPLNSDPNQVVTKLVNGKVVLLSVPEEFQRNYKTEKVINAKFIDGRFSDKPDGGKTLSKNGFVFPDYHKIGPLTFEEIVFEGRYCKVGNYPFEKAKDLDIFEIFDFDYSSTSHA